MSAVPSRYPQDAVEFTVTFLLPVTDENRADVDGSVTDLLNGVSTPTDPLTWWPERIIHYVDHRMQTRFDLIRPPEFVRPKPKRVKP